ncbi:MULTISPECIES: hypothetical protein [Rhodomicrobium]|uniref:hypothetical protein n=1 Tax=Rhodomicrobium TaxID=1068 RepID=UPI000B4B6D55|nr:MULTISPECIES: hypothetical protein [Rhodomicrobium]
MIDEILARAQTRKLHGLSAMPYAVVENGVVINMVMWDPNEFPDWKPVRGELVQSDGTAAIGHVYAEGRFTDPNYVEPVLLPLETVKMRRIREVNSQFISSSGGLFVSPETVKEMRDGALAAIEQIKLAETREDALHIRNAALVALLTAEAVAEGGFVG